MADQMPQLDDLRREIDEIDEQLHALLMRRAAIALTIGQVKADGPVYARPGREAQILRRLLARHSGAFPPVALVRIWREIISALTALQGPFSIAVYAPEGDRSMISMARYHFGSLAPFTLCESPLGVLRSVTEGKATLGVLPYPQADDPDPWWRVLARSGEQQPRVVAHLPVLADSGNGQRALAVAQIAPEDSGDDCSLLVAETSEDLSRGTLVRRLETVGFTVKDVMHWDGEPDIRMHLIEIDGFLAPDDRRFAALQEAAPDEIRQVWTIGGYARPLQSEQALADQAEAGR